MDAPLWVTLLVGLGAGVAGTLISTRLQISHERVSELRSRMLAAADDYVVTGDAAVSAAFDKSLAQRHPDARAELAEAQETYSRHMDDLMSKHSRIRLLFGPDSAAAVESGLVVEHVLALDSDQASNALDRFCEAAVDQLRGPTTQRFRRNPK